MLKKFKYITIIFLIVFCPLMAIAQNYFVKNDALISWYGEPFHGRPTSSGEIFNMNDFTAAHKTLPFGTMLEIINQANGKRVIVRVNDRGPFVDDRELDVSMGAAKELDIVESGVAKVLILEIANNTKNEEATEKTVETVTKEVVEAEDSKSVEDLTPVLIEYEDETLVVEETESLIEDSEIDVSITWRIQLASFSYEENAIQFVRQLRKKGFNPAFEKTEKMTRVVIAKIPNNELESLKEKLSKEGYREYLLRQEN